jgi:hypothetical protein
MKTGLKERMAQLRAEGKSQEEALFTAAHEGYIDPRLAEKMLSAVAPASAFNAQNQAPIGPPHVPQSFPPSAPSPAQLAQSFPPSGPAPQRPTPDQIQQMAAQGADPRKLAALKLPIRGQAQAEDSSGLTPEKIMAYAQQRGGLSPYETELLKKQLGPQMDPAMLAALMGGKAVQ